MAGLSLLGSGQVTAALPPSQGSASTITQMAYGVGSGADVSGGDKTAGFGTAAGAVLGIGLLCWLWWTLPH
jgi:hypothetical protein